MHSNPLFQIFISLTFASKQPHCSHNKPPTNWTQGLRESIYRTLNRYNDPDPYLRTHLQNIPIQNEKIINEPLFGDIVALAKGVIYQSQNRYYKLIQDCPVNCNQLDRFDELIGIWTVERIRQHTPNGYAYEFQYKVVPRNQFQHPITRTDGSIDYTVPGHLYIVKVCSISNWNPPTTPNYSVWVHRHNPTLISIWNTKLNPKYTTPKYPVKDSQHKPTLETVWVHKDIDRSFQIKPPPWPNYNSFETFDPNGIKHTIHFPDFSPEVSNDEIFGGPVPPSTKETIKSTSTISEDFLNTLGQKFTTQSDRNFDDYFHYVTTSTTMKPSTTQNAVFLGFNNDVTTEMKSTTYIDDFFDFIGENEKKPEITSSTSTTTQFDPVFQTITNRARPGSDLSLSSSNNGGGLNSIPVTTKIPTLRDLVTTPITILDQGTVADKVCQFKKLQPSANSSPLKIFKFQKV